MSEQSTYLEENIPEIAVEGQLRHMDHMAHLNALDFSAKLPGITGTKLRGRLVR